MLSRSAYAIDDVSSREIKHMTSSFQTSKLHPGCGNWVNHPLPCSTDTDSVHPAAAHFTRLSTLGRSTVVCVYIGQVFGRVVNCLDRMFAVLLLGDRSSATVVALDVDVN